MAVMPADSALTIGHPAGTVGIVAAGDGWLILRKCGPRRLATHPPIACGSCTALPRCRDRARTEQAPLCRRLGCADRGCFRTIGPRSGGLRIPAPARMQAPLADSVAPRISPRAGLRSLTEPRRCYRNRAGPCHELAAGSTTPATPIRRLRTFLFHCYRKARSRLAAGP